MAKPVPGNMAKKLSLKSPGTIHLDVLRCGHQGYGPTPRSHVRAVQPAAPTSPEAPTLKLSTSRRPTNPNSRITCKRTAAQQ